MRRLIVHIAEVNLTQESGMGRVSWFWKNEFEQRGYEFIHIGPKEVGQILHPAWFPYAALSIYRKLQVKPSLILVHEPASGIFLNAEVPVVLFSHGIERRAWNLSLQENGSQHPKRRTKLLFPLWRLRQCDRGLQKANMLLLINQEDCEFVQQHYYRCVKDIYQFKNGAFPSELDETMAPVSPLTILFLGSWIERKGIKTLVKAAYHLYRQGIHPKWLLAGTGLEQEAVLLDWPQDLHPYLEVIPKFQVTEEQKLFARSHLFILPSFFEGQPLSLLQAMMAGRCCITTNCCGQKDLIQHGDNGLLYEPEDAEKLADLIKECTLNPSLRLSLGAKAKSSVHGRTWKSVSVEVVDQIENLICQY